MKRILVFIPILLFLLTIVVVGNNLGKPFIGIHDWNGARYGNIARNYLRYGFFTTKFSQVENSGEVRPSEFRYLTHYPPLLPILISASYRIFGINEWATRLVSLLATAGAIVLIYLIGRTIFNEEAGVSASLLALATPMVRYFGKNPVHEPLVFNFSLLAFLGILFVLKKRKKGWFLVFLGSALTLLTNWSGIFLIIAASFILFRRVSNKRLITLWVFGIALVILHLIQVYKVSGSPFGGGLWEAFLQRTSLGGTASLTPFGPIEFLDRLRLWASTLFTISLLLVSFVGSTIIFKKERQEVKRLFVGFLIFGLGQELLFPNAAYIHNYFIYPFLLFLVLTGAFSIFFISKRIKVSWLLILLVLFLLTWFERRPHLLALEASQNDLLAYQAGREMARMVPKGDIVLVKPFDYGASRLPILAFYSDRKIVLKRDSMYNWIVNVDEEKGQFALSCISGCSLKR